MTFKQYNLQKKYSRYNIYIKHRHFVPKILRSLIESPIVSPKNKKSWGFDLYISLGNNCLPAIALRILNLRTSSFPFDWLCGVPLERNLDWILKDFRDFLNYSPEKVLEGDIHLRVENIATGTFFIHDFLTNSLTEFQSIKEKYKRRSDRLLFSCKNKKLLFLYIESNPDKINYLTEDKKILQKLDQVKEKLKAKDVRLILLHHSKEETGKIKVLQSENSTLYLFSSPKAKQMSSEKEKLGLALLLNEILQTIKADTKDYPESSSSTTERPQQND